MAMTRVCAIFGRRVLYTDGRGACVIDSKKEGCRQSPLENSNFEGRPKAKGGPQPKGERENLQGELGRDSP